MIFRTTLTLFLVAGFALAQAPGKKDTTPKEPAKPAPGSLEDTLEKALRNSADIKAGEAKVREAEAELNKIRHQVLTKATALHSDLSLAKRMLTVAEQTLARHVEAHKSGATSVEGLLGAQSLVEKHRGEVEKLEAELKSLRGEFAIKSWPSVAFTADGSRLYSAFDGTVRIWDAVSGKEIQNFTPLYEAIGTRNTAVATVPASMADRVRKLLEHEIEWDANNARIPEMVKWLTEAAKSDVPVRDLVEQVANEATITLKGKMSVKAWFQALEDSDPKICIVVRDYGLLVTKKDRMPSGAVSISEFGKAKDKPKEEKK